VCVFVLLCWQLSHSSDAALELCVVYDNVIPDPNSDEDEDAPVVKTSTKKLLSSFYLFFGDVIYFLGTTKKLSRVSSPKAKKVEG
jgi:hypothetical protein